MNFNLVAPLPPDTDYLDVAPGKSSRRILLPAFAIVVALLAVLAAFVAGILVSAEWPSWITVTAPISPLS